MKKEEIAFIYGYTDDEYESLNERLRKKNGEIDTEFGRELDRILAKLPNFEGFTFRGTMLSSKHLKIYKEAFEFDKVVTEPTFLSTSRVEAIARMYMRLSRDSHQVLFKIFCKQGKSIEKYSKFDSLSGQNEKEILFRPNTQFEIVDIDTSNTSIIIITLNEIIKNGTT